MPSECGSICAFTIQILFVHFHFLAGVLGHQKNVHAASLSLAVVIEVEGADICYLQLQVDKSASVNNMKPEALYFSMSATDELRYQRAEEGGGEILSASFEDHPTFCYFTRNISII